jgi:uncharacterized OB-fold protein
MTQAHPIHDGLFSWPDQHPQLLGSQCNHCNEVAFPAQNDCRACGGHETTVIKIGDRGSLWSWTIQTFMPKDPYHSDETEQTFKPYGVGYVEMPGGVRVEARLTHNQPEQLSIGMPMQLQIVPFRKDADGNDVMTFCFSAINEE